jgi:DNA-directed RNA polymerase specialized sigma24 family protein
VTVRVKTRTLAVEADEISRANYEPLKEEVLRAVGGKLRSKGMSMISQDLEVAYNEAWHQLTQHIIRGKPVTSLVGLLYKMTYSRAVDIYRSPQERRRVDLDLEQHRVETDIAEQLDDQEKLTRLLGRLKDRLNDKERNAVTLCTLHGYTRPEAADKLGIDRIVFERIMDGATKKMSGIVASIEARGCGEKEWADLMLAYAHHQLDEDDKDYPRAWAHVDGPDPCEACRRYVNGLRGLAAVMPPLLPPGLLVGHEAGVLAHLAKFFEGGHVGSGASAALGASGTGATGGAATVALGGTATKAVLLAGAAALSIAGAAAVATHHSGASHPPTPPVTATHVLDIRALTPNVGIFSDQLSSPRHQSPTRRTAGGARRANHDAEFRRRPRTLRQEAPPEFGFEAPPTKQQPGRAATTATTAAPTPTTPPAAHQTNPVNGKHGEFGFEKQK